MRKVSLAWAAPLLMIAGAVACGDDSNGTGGTTATGSATTVATSSSSVGSGGSGTIAECHTDLFIPGCDQCLADHCCGAAKAADGNPDFPDLKACRIANCAMECYISSDPPFNLSCTPPPSSPSNGSCVAVGGDNQCNPITQDGCNVANGEACDRQVAPDGSQIGFKCYPSMNTNDACQPCNDGAGYCKPGLSCFEHCGKMCCDDGDCGNGSTCRKSDDFGDNLFPVTPGLGLCAQ